MKAMILAAGRGTRLAPLTETVPKILAPVLGIPMLDRLRAWLGSHGVSSLAINTHHLPDAVAAHLAGEASSLLPVRIFHEPELLGTGGALVNAGPFWQADPLLVWNGDIVCGLDPRALMAEHTRRGGLATLAVQERQSDSYLLVDEAGSVCGLDSARRGVRRLDKTPTGKVRPMAFNGISVLSPDFRRHMPSSGTFDLIDALLRAVESGGSVLAHDAGAAFYGTTGSLEKLRALEAGLEARPEILEGWTP